MRNWFVQPMWQREDRRKRLLASLFVPQGIGSRSHPQLTRNCFKFPVQFRQLIEFGLCQCGVRGLSRFDVRKSVEQFFEVRIDEIWLLSHGSVTPLPAILALDTGHGTWLDGQRLVSGPIPRPLRLLAARRRRRAKTLARCYVQIRP